MDNGHFITVLLGVIFGLWVLLLGVGSYCLKRISDKLDDLVVVRDASWPLPTVTGTPATTGSSFAVPMTMSAV